MVTIKRDRYVVFNVITDIGKIEESILKTSIWKTFQTIFGLVGSSSAGLYFEKYDDLNKKGIIRCTHTSLSQLLAVLAMITELKERRILIQVLNISGTINKAKKCLTQNNFIV